MQIFTRSSEARGMILTRYWLAIPASHFLMNRARNASRTCSHGLPLNAIRLGEPLLNCGLSGGVKVFKRFAPYLIQGL